MRWQGVNLLNGFRTEGGCVEALLTQQSRSASAVFLEEQRLKGQLVRWFIEGCFSALVFFICSYILWNDWRIWQHPLFFPQIVGVFGILLIGKGVLHSRINKTGERSRLALLWVLAFYGCVALFTMLLVPDYPQTFLWLTLLPVLIWQIIDLLLRRSKRALKFVVAPGVEAEKLKAIQGVDFEILKEPSVAFPIDGLVVDVSEALSPDWMRFVAESTAKGVPVYHAAFLYEAATARVPLEYADAKLLSERINRSARYQFIKRIFDLVIVFVSLPVVLPICVLTAIAIKLDSPGPVLFRQNRVGKDGETFSIVKFRSMYQDAEKHGAQFASANDDRITRVGHIIRRFRIDELPQLWNVLRGEMSIVGPRPEQVDFVRRFEKEIPFYQWRHRVKPGITGLAQVKQGYAAGLDDTLEKLEYDLYYVKNLSFFLDISILLQTVRILLTGYGAR